MAGQPHAEAATPAGAFTTSITARHHTAVADEANSADAAMTPIEMLLASLCACTTITARMYADRKGYAVRDIRAEAKGVREGGRDVGPLDAIDMTLTIEGDLTDAERERLVEIAGRCPVHRTIAAGVSVRTHAQ